MRATRYLGAEVMRGGQMVHLGAQDLSTIPDRITVAPDMHFVGPDAYKKLVASDSIL